MDDQIFDFDEFFVPQSDPGVEVLVPIKGRLVPIRVKKGITLGDMKAAQSKAVIQKMKPGGGIEVVGLDEDKFTTELMFRCIVSWPFKRNTGTSDAPNWVPVELSRENMTALLAEGAAFLEQYLTSQTQGAQQTAAPLEKASGAVS